MVKHFHLTQKKLLHFALPVYNLLLKQCAKIQNFCPKFLIFLKFRTLEGTLPCTISMTFYISYLLFILNYLQIVALN